MSLFDNIQTPATAATDEDVLPSGVLRVVPSDCYPVKVKLAYLGQSTKGAMFMHLVMEQEPDAMFEVTERIYFTTRDGKTTYTSGNEERPLPGFQRLDELCKAITGNGLLENKPEKKTIKLWSYEQKKEVPTEVEVFTTLMGQNFQAGLIRKIENKRVQDELGEWVAGPEKREFNTLDKAFTADGLTVKETKAGVKEPEFKKSWLDKRKGKDRDEYDPAVAAKSAGVAPTPSTTKSLFD
jgi:hypothetical protein